MNKLLASTALVGAMFLAAPAFAHDVKLDVLNGTFDTENPTDIVLNGQANLHSPTKAVGVDAYANRKVNVDVKNVDVTAVGNLNETVANGGGSTFDLTASSNREASSSKDTTRSDKSLNVSYSKKVKNRNGSYGGGKTTKTTLSASGSAWTKTQSSERSYSSSKEFDISATRRNSVFVGSLQVNAGSPTTAIGVDAGIGNSHGRNGGGVVNVDVKNMNVTAIGNTNSTRLK